MAIARQRAAARLWIFCTALVLALVIVALAFANWFAQRKLISQIERDTQTLMNHERLTGWTLQVHQDGLEQELLRLARSADLKEAIVAGSRAALLDQLEPPLNRLRKSPLNITRITLYTPEGTARMRAHTPDSYGDNVLSDRPLIAETVRDRRILKGLEVESGLLCLWAATPIYHRGRVIGILEVGSSLAPIIKAIRLVAGGEVAVLLGGTPPRATESSNPQFFASAVPLLSANAAEAGRQVVVLDEKTYAASLIPLKDFSGRQAGRLAILSDTTGITGLLQKSHAAAFGISFLGLALAAGLLIVLTLKLDQFYANLERLYEEARQTRDFLHSILEHSPDSVIMTDTAGQITYVSPRGQEAFGYRPEDLLGTSAASYYRFGLEEAQTIMQRLRAEGRIRNYETALRAQDGRWVEVNVSATLLRNAAGEITGTLGIVKDISERVRLEEQLRRSQRM